MNSWQTGAPRPRVSAEQKSPVASEKGGRDLEPNSKSVLDASAVLAYLQREPGFEIVQKALMAGAYIGSVNLAEVLGKVVSRVVDAKLVGERLLALGLETVPFNTEDALETAQLYLLTKDAGLSLGDRACLALARRLSLPALTADTAWDAVDVAVTIRQIRR